MSSKIVKAIQAINVKDLLARAGWTFVQAFLAVFLFTSESIIDLLFLGDWTGLYGLLLTTVVAATAAGLSAVKTIVLQVVREIKAKA